MKKKINKIISVLLVMSLIIAMVNNEDLNRVVKAEAVNDGIEVEKLLEQVEESEVTVEEIETVEKDLEVLESVGITKMAREINIVNEKSSFVYEVEYVAEKNEISNIEYTAEGISFDCAQGCIDNTVEIKEDGSAYLNGQKVEMNENAVKKNDECIFVQNDFQTWFQKECPYGYAYDYTANAGSSKCADVNLKNAIKDITLSAFIAVICAVLGVGNVASFCASAAYTFMASYRPSAKGLSYKLQKKYHKKYAGKYIGYAGCARLITRYNYTWYSDYGYRGTALNDYAYHIKEHY